MLQKLYDLRKSKKGFTLVELIVVLVILAILAALLIPALTGYIDKAKTKQIVAQTRQAVMAAQTIYDEAYGADSSADESDIAVSDVKTLAEVGGTISGIAVSSGKITALTYKEGSDTCVYAYASGKTTYTVNGKVASSGGVDTSDNG